MIARDGLVRTGPQALIRLPQSTTQNLPVQVNAVWQQMVLLLQSTASYLRMQSNATRQRSRCLCIAGTATEPPALLQSMQPQPHYPRLRPPLLLPSKRKQQQPALLQSMHSKQKL